MTPRARFAAVRLYVVLTPDTLPGDPRSALEAALASGAVGAVQLRLKPTSADHDRGVAAWTADLAPLCAAHGALLLLNDDPTQAAALALDGAHVGQTDTPVAAARRAVGEDRVLGLSTHDPAEVRAARELPIDYVGLGPCFASESKTLSRRPSGSALLAACRPEAGPLPVFPIGGITTTNAPQLIAAGADRLAVGAGVLADPDPGAAARLLRDLLPD